MKQYTEIIRATEVDGSPVSVHLAGDAPQWLINEATVWVRAIACRGPSTSLANPESESPYKPGDRIVATREDSQFYRKGDAGVLLDRDIGGGWLADFGHGKWWISECNFTLAEPEPDAFKEAMVNIEDLHRVHRVLRLLADRVKALEEQR